MTIEVDVIGGFPYADPNCKGCGEPLTVENAWVTDGCPCNSPLGINNKNETRWRLLMQLQQRDSQRAADAEREVEQMQVQMAGISVAAFGGTKEPAKQGDYGWSVPYQDVLDLRIRFDTLETDLRQAVEALRKAWASEYGWKLYREKIQAEKLGWAADILALPARHETLCNQFCFRYNLDRATFDELGIAE